MLEVVLVKCIIFKTEELEKFFRGACIGKRIPRSVLIHDLLAIEIKFYFSN